MTDRLYRRCPEDRMHDTPRHMRTIPMCSTCLNTVFIPVDDGILVQGDFTSVTEMIEKLRVEPVSGFTFTNAGRR
jgi:hypothetical protein